MNEFDEIKEMVDKSNFDGYKAAFLGAMAGWEKSMRLSVRYIEHVTGKSDDSVTHYWSRDCDVCKEIAKFIQDWGEGGRTSRALDVCPECFGDGSRPSSIGRVFCDACNGTGKRQ